MQLDKWVGKWSHWFSWGKRSYLECKGNSLSWSGQEKGGCHENLCQTWDQCKYFLSWSYLLRGNVLKQIIEKENTNVYFCSINLLRFKWNWQLKKPSNLIYDYDLNNFHIRIWPRIKTINQNIPVWPSILSVLHINLIICIIFILLQTVYFNFRGRVQEKMEHIKNSIYTGKV